MRAKAKDFPLFQDWKNDLNLCVGRILAKDTHDATHLGTCHAAHLVTKPDGDKMPQILCSFNSNIMNSFTLTICDHNFYIDHPQSQLSLVQGLTAEKRLDIDQSIQWVISQPSFHLQICIYGEAVNKWTLFGDIVPTIVPVEAKHVTAANLH